MNTSILAKDILSFSNSFPHYDLLRNKRLLITGATGLIGSILTKCLLALDNLHQLQLQLICPVRNMEKAKEIFSLTDSSKAITFLPLNLEEITVEHITTPIDFVIHLAAPTASKYFVDYPVETFLTVIEGTRQILDFACAKTVSRMVYVSSLEVYGTVTDDARPLTESCQGYIDPMDVRSSYSMGKRAAECLCHAYAEEKSLSVSTARLAQTFGAGVEVTDRRVFAQFAMSAVCKEDIVLHTTGELSRMYCYTTDAVSALLHILLFGKAGEAYNVANPTTYISIKEMAKLVRQKFAPEICVKTILQEGHGYAPTTRLKLDNTKVFQLGWRPRLDLEEMFQRLIQHLSESLE